MFKTDALILLVNSMTKAEKKSFKSNSRKSDYLTLFDIIDKNKTVNSDELKNRFWKSKNSAKK